MDRLEAVERLAKLRDEGILSDDEFDIQKQRLLRGPAKVVTQSENDSKADPASRSAGAGPHSTRELGISREDVSSGVVDLLYPVFKVGDYRSPRARNLTVALGLLGLIALALSNPTEADLRKEMVSRVNTKLASGAAQDSGSSMLAGLVNLSGVLDYAVARIPVRRSNFGLFSTFDVDLTAYKSLGFADRSHLCFVGIAGQFVPCEMGNSELAPSTTNKSVAPTPTTRPEEADGETANLMQSEGPPDGTMGSTDSSSEADTDEAEAPEAVAPPLPSFSQFAVQANNAVAALQLERSSPFWDYRTRIRDAYQSRPNFGSNGVITTWGCGTGCQFGALVDRSSGTVHDVPVGGEEEQELDIQTQRGSNLMLANWTDAKETDPVCVFEAYVWTGREFKELSGFPKKVSGSCPVRD